jgi:radical SAM/Cys-rich protein
METDEEFKLAAKRLKAEGQRALTKEERARRRRALDGLDVPNFDAFVVDRGASALVREPTTILQVNIGLYCNQACSHCHVESSPLRREEVMSEAVAARLVELIDASKKKSAIKTLDVTGGAPELMAQFRPLVLAARQRGLDVIDRCNLTVLYEPGQEDLPEFLAENGVKVVASLPCYSEANTDAQRGVGVFERSIAALKRLNEVGYGIEGTDLELDLMYNPGGAFLPPSQETLDVAYRSELGDAYGVKFSKLFTLTNMPIKRFADYLHREGKTEAYMKLLVDNFNPAAAEGVMCRDLVSVSWDGRLFDCDFNQQLDMPMKGGNGGDGGLSVFDVASLDELVGRKLAVDNHCFGCTAGAGSSCSGSTA